MEIAERQTVLRYRATLKIDRVPEFQRMFTFTEKVVNAIFPVGLNSHGGRAG